MKTLKLLTLVLFIILIGCINKSDKWDKTKISSIDNLQPPIPLEKISVSEELEYIYKTDQDDRRKWFFDRRFNYNKRDSIRLKRVWELYKQGKIKIIKDKEHAAIVFHHADGHLDSMFHHIAYKLYYEVAKYNINAGNGETNFLEYSFTRWQKSLKPATEKEKKYEDSIKGLSDKEFDKYVETQWNKKDNTITYPDSLLKLLATGDSLHNLQFDTLSENEKKYTKIVNKQIGKYIMKLMSERKP